MNASTKIIVRKLFSVLRVLGVNVELTPALMEINGACVGAKNIFMSKLTGNAITIGGHIPCGSAYYHVKITGLSRHVSYSALDNDLGRCALGALLHAMDGMQISAEKFIAVIEVAVGLIIVYEKYITKIADEVIQDLTEELAAAKTKNVVVTEKDGVITLSTRVDEKV